MWSTAQPPVSAIEHPFEGVVSRPRHRGLTPLAYMLSIVRDETAKTELRNDMAKAAAPYVDPRLAPIEHSGTDENNVSRRWVVEIVPCPKREDPAPAHDSLQSNGIACLQGPSQPSADGIISWVNGEIPSGGRPWPGE